MNFIYAIYLILFLLLKIKIDLAESLAISKKLDASKSTLFLVHKNFV